MTKKEEDAFLWGVTQIGQQSEGYCPASNWTMWARRGLVPPCGRGNDYWQKYSEDHDAVETLGVGAFRLSIDWARIEPEEGVFDAQAVVHYRQILGDIKKRKIKTVVGLWHYSVPAWFEQDYGMHHKRAREFFLRFVTHVRDALGDRIDYVVVLNEPMVYVGTSYLQRSRPPFIKNLWQAWRVLRHLIGFHNDTYNLWREKYPHTPVGSTHLWNHIESAHHTMHEKIAVRLSQYFRYGYIIGRLQYSSDFIGINYYTADKIYFRGMTYLHTGIVGFHGTALWHSPDVWRDFPAGLTRVLRDAAVYKKPLYIFENGKPTHSGVHDVDRQQFITESVIAVDDARKDGVDVRGYFYYALADAYEWMSGYDFKFGLIEVKRDTLKRVRRKSFTVYKNIIKTHEKIS